MTSTEHLPAVDAPGAPGSEAGVTLVESVLTEATCSVSCWTARQAVCRCSCGGANHGIALTGGTPTRTRKSGAARYELVAVVARCDDPYGQAGRLAAAVQGDEADRDWTLAVPQWFHPRPSYGPPPPVAVESATSRHMRWPEVVAAVGQWGTTDGSDLPPMARPHLIWRRLD